MLRTAAFLAVRQQHHDAAGLAPFGFRRGNELIDDDLRAVGEIAVLRFPQHQRERIGHAVAEFETDDAVLAQRAVVDLEARLARSQMLQRRVDAAGFGVVIFGVALAEGAASGILAAQAHRRAFQNQAAERQSFGQSPVDERTAVAGFVPALDHSLQLGMQLEIGGKRGDAVENSADHRDGPPPWEEDRRAWPRRATGLSSSSSYSSLFFTVWS